MVGDDAKNGLLCSAPDEFALSTVRALFVLFDREVYPGIEFVLSTLYGSCLLRLHGGNFDRIGKSDKREGV